MPGPAVGQNYSMPRGDSRTLRLPVRDDDGVAVDLAGSAARYWIARRSSGVGVLLEKATDGDGIVIEQSGSLYTLVVTIEPEDTESLSPGYYYHEAEVVDADGDVATVMTGQYTLTPTIIRPA